MQTSSYSLVRHARTVAGAAGLLITVAFAAAGCHPAQSAHSPDKVQETPARPVENSDPPDREQVPPPATIAPPAEPQQLAQAAPAPVYRPTERNTQYDDALLARVGIRRFDSKHLRLYTDIEPEIARTLPPLMDQAYAAWEDYFGPMPPNREGTPFRMTGYLIRDEELFVQTRLLPTERIQLRHGKHLGSEFWMRDQELDYYRRHLMLHEGTHCFMTYMPDSGQPVWYLEGMAELFGTHRFREDGSVQFRVIPADKLEFRGFGRVTVAQNDIAKRGYRRLVEIERLTPNDFAHLESYAWSWLICTFLDGHPQYRERFRNVGRFRGAREFRAEFQAAFGPDLKRIQFEWPLYAHGFVHGFDLSRAAIDFQRGRPLPPEGAHSASIAADRGWQSSGVLVEAGREYAISASGRFTVAEIPKPWISEAGGISFRYFEGRPVGMLLAAIRHDQPALPGDYDSMLQVIPIGTQARFVAPITGTMYLRLNDDWSELADNRGAVEVLIRGVDTSY